MSSLLRWLGLTTGLTLIFTGCSLYLEQWLQPPIMAEAQVEGPVIVQPRFQVLITGEVQAPGKYHLSHGALLAELVQQAGGLKATALIHPRELLRQLKPGEVVYIPALSAQPEGLSVSQTTQTPREAPIQPLDLNTATEADLLKIPGIGPATAQRIIAHRQQYGLFNSPQDLLKIKGIGPKTLSRMQAWLQ